MSKKIFDSTIVERARKNDLQAFSELFEITQEKAYYTALKITKNPEDAKDMMQEAYVKVYTSLNKLDDDSKFVSWFNCIVANKCKDYLIKKKPDLFSKYDNDDNELEFEDTIENQDASLIPHQVADNKETKRLIMECINHLPDDQRICVVMFYYDEMSVKDIASALNVSENTIKSRLNYARKRLKSEFQTLEEKGTKLYGVPVATLVRWAFSKDSSKIHLPPLPKRTIAKSIVNAVAKTSATSGKIVATVATIGAKKIISVAISVTVAAATVGTVAAINTKNKNKIKNTVETTVAVANTEETQTTLKAEDVKTVVTCNDVVVSDGNNTMYYSTEKSIVRTDYNAKNNKEIYNHSASSFVLSDNLYFISNGKFYCYNINNDKIDCMFDVKSSSIVADGSNLYGINKDKTRCYKIDIAAKSETQFTIDGTDIQIIKNYIYYRDSSNSVLRKDLNDMSKSAHTVIAYNDNKEKLLYPYFISNDVAYYSQFSSDSNGRLYTNSITTQKSSSINLGKGYIDVAVFDSNIYYSTASNFYKCDLNGENVKKISNSPMYFESKTSAYSAWLDSSTGQTEIINNKSGNVIYIANSSMDDFQVIGQNIIYKSSDKTYVESLQA